MTKVIDFKAKGRPKLKAVEASAHRYKVQWQNVTHLERMANDVCKVWFIGGNFIIVDRSFTEMDKIADKIWGDKR